MVVCVWGGGGAVVLPIGYILDNLIRHVKVYKISRIFKTGMVPIF